MDAGAAQNRDRRAVHAAMVTLVVGGAGSGKSEYAERELCRRSGELTRVYLATMRPLGAEAEARIKKHRAQRAQRGFVTVERYLDLPALSLPTPCAVLLEDIGNLCANELYDPLGSGDGAEEAVVSGVAHLSRLTRELVVVSNETGAGGAAYAGDTLRYLRTLGRINRRLAQLSDRVCEVAALVPVYYKGAADAPP